MTIRRMEHAGIVVDVLAAATAHSSAGRSSGERPLEFASWTASSLRLRARGAELVGEVERYEDSYRLCYVRGPEGIIVELAEQIG